MFFPCLNLRNDGTLLNSSTIAVIEVSLAVTAITELLNMNSAEPLAYWACNCGCLRALSQNHVIRYTYCIVERLPFGVSYTLAYSIDGKPCKFVAL
jgi:hypothetical protein